jgi:hypothetical protein
MEATDDLVTALQRICQDAAKGRNPILTLKLVEVIDKAFSKA